MSSVNGLELKTPEDAGFSCLSIHNNPIDCVILRNGLPIGYVLHNDDKVQANIGKLVKLPAPKKYRPYRRGEVRCGDVFRSKIDGTDNSVVRVYEEGLWLGSNHVTFQGLFSNYHKLTLSPDGEECVSSAGVEE